MGIRENRLVEAVLTNTHNLCYEQKCEKYQIFFLSENFHVLVVNFSVYLNWHVFVMVSRIGWQPILLIFFNLLALESSIF